MVHRADVQRFIIWLSGSVTVFGFIATLVAYLIYGGNSCPQDSSDDKSCTTIDSKDNTILKIIGPVFMVTGILTIISIRCWQNNTRETTVVATISAVNGNGNTAFDETEFDCGSPPSYSEALHMRIVVEGNVTFPSEPPPKYDDLVAVVEQEAPQTPADVPSRSQGNQGNNNHNDSITDNNDENIQGNVDSENGNTPQTREADQGNGRQEETPTADGVNGQIIAVDSEESAQQRSGETTENNTTTGLQEQFENEASSQNHSEVTEGLGDEILV